MLLSYVNPFIRFAQPVNFFGTNTATVSYDSRLFYILDGNCILSVCGKEHKLTPGTLLIWKSGIPYKFSVTGCVRILSVNFDFTQKNSQKKESMSPVPQSNFAKENLLEKIFFTDFETLNSPIILHNMQQFESKINLIADEFSKKKLGYDSVCSAILKEVIVGAVRIALFNIPENSGKIEKVLQYIEKNYNRNISNKELADIAGYHPYHLNRLIKTTIGMTLHQYMLNVRIEKAKEYLRNTNLTIADISDRCGFENPYHFSNTFKKSTNYSPSQFRKELKNTL